MDMQHFSAQLFRFYTDQLGTLALVSLVVPLALLGAHFVSIGVHQRIEPRRETTLSTRWERGVHWVRLAGFAGAVGTGLLLGAGRVGFDWAPRQAVFNLHLAAGGVLGLFTLVSLIMWYRECCFNREDLPWLRQAGGYLGKQLLLLEAGRFNAGQKLFFWLSALAVLLLGAGGVLLYLAKYAYITLSGWIALMLFTTHGFLALLLVVLVMGHAYLAILNKSWAAMWKMQLEEK